MNSRQDPNADKHGQALSAQRFQMIKDIAAATEAFNTVRAAIDEAKQKEDAHA